jgi:LPS-assembly lipoprotein
MQRRFAIALVGRSVLAGLGVLALSACGFKLRGAQRYAFKTLAVMPNPGGVLAAELRRSLGGGVHVLAPQEPPTQAQVVLDILQEQREKIVVGINSSGQVREFQLRVRVKFSVRTPQGKELAPEAEVLLQRDISFNESVALAKEAEEVLLYRDMQTDAVQQVLRRLAMVRLD